MNTIAIDCGASFIKGALVSMGGGKILRQIKIPAPAVSRSGSVFSPRQITALIPLVRKMILELASLEKEAYLCISNEMHGFILSYGDGTPFTDYISWQKELGKNSDGPGAGVLTLQNNCSKEDLLFTGMPLRAGLPSSNLACLSAGGTLEKADGALFFYTLGDYILKALSSKEPACHPSNAAATGLYDLRKNNWNRGMIRIAGGSDISFPEIGTGELVFRLEHVWLHALPAIGDQQAALLGAGLKDERTLSFNLGTGAQVSRLVSDAACSCSYQIRPYFYNYYLKTLPHIPSGRALNVYIRFIEDILKHFQVEVDTADIWNTLIAAASETDSSALECDLSFFENTITASETGSISNIGEYSFTLGALSKSIFEQMGKNFIYAADIIEGHGSNTDKIIFSGGIAAKIPVIRKQIAGHYGKGIEVSVAFEETLLGLCRYGEDARKSI